MCCRGAVKTCRSALLTPPLPLVPPCACTCSCAPCCRGGGWGPLRRAPVQHLDMRGRPGLLRTTLEAQETRGLTRSDDLSRLLPSEVGDELASRAVMRLQGGFAEDPRCALPVDGGTSTAAAPRPKQRNLLPPCVALRYRPRCWRAVAPCARPSSSSLPRWLRRRWPATSGMAGASSPRR